MAKLRDAGLLKIYDFALQTSRYLPEDVAIAGARTIANKEAVIVGQAALLLHGVPQTIRVTATGHDADGREVRAEVSLEAVDHHSPNSYRFPLRGNWFIAAGPNFEGHHRWATSQEFALDIIRTGGEHGLTHSGDGAKMEEYYAFDAEVVAVADGVVADVQDRIADDPAILQKKGESDEAYLERSAAWQMNLLVESPRAIGGNFVVVRHEGGEHSLYGHLKNGSVAVKKSDKVTRGQIIGRLGGSGNSTEPHLHFHMAEGPDPLYSRGIPVRFENVSVIDHGSEPLQLQGGWMVDSGK